MGSAVISLTLVLQFRVSGRGISSLRVVTENDGFYPTPDSHKLIWSSSAPSGRAAERPFAGIRSDINLYLSPVCHVFI